MRRICRGCIATAGTADEVLEEMRAAIRFHIDGLLEDGLSIPEPASRFAYVDA